MPRAVGKKEKTGNISAAVRVKTTEKISGANSKYIHIFSVAIL